MNNTAENTDIDDFDRFLQISANTGQITQEELVRLRQYLNYDMIFNRDYTWGYTSALLDILSLFEKNKIQDIQDGKNLDGQYTHTQKIK